MDLFGKYENDEEFINKAKGFLNEFKNKETVLWGKGRITSTLLKFADNLNIKYIVDNNKDLHGTVFHGYDIVSPENLRNEDKNNTKIIIMPNDCQHRDIAKILANMGFDNNSFCTCRDYLTAHSYFNKNKVVLPNLEFIITSICSLKCKYCIAQIPYFNKNKFYQMPFSTVKENIDRVFNNIDYIGMFQLSTGEVLLHLEADKIIEYISETYRDKYNELTFVTNGTVIPSEKLLQSLKKNIDFIQISNYIHPDIQKQLKVEKLKKLFDNYNINCFFSNYATGKLEIRWNDIGDLSVPKNRSLKENAELYQDCSMQVCKCMFEDKIYPCTVACYASLGGINEPAIDKENINYVSITGKSLDIVKFYLRAAAKDHPHICDYCNGVGTHVNDRLILAGEQL